MKTIIFMNSWHIGGSIVLKKLLQDPTIHITALVVRPVWSGFSFQKRRIGYFGAFLLTVLTLWHFIPMIFFECLGMLMLWSVGKYCKRSITIAEENGIPIHYTNDVHNEQTLAFLHIHQPDIIFLNHFNQIIKKEILAIPSVGVFNLHPGKIPEYKGNFPTFWALLKGENSIGVTLHRVDEGLDTGGIVAEKILKITKKTTLLQAIEKSAHALAVLSKKIIQRIQKKKNISEIKRTGGNTFSFPKSEHLLEFIEKDKQFW